MTTVVYTLSALAERFGLEARGDAGLEVRGVATLAKAGDGQPDPMQTSVGYIGADAFHRKSGGGGGRGVWGDGVLGWG